MDLASYMMDKTRMIDQALEKALPQTQDLSANLVKAMRYSLFAGGKRLRPILCLAGAEAVGAPARAALPAALALEMIHTASLIHDDLPAMDDDDFRRGRPANHKVFGEGMAILAGVGLLMRAFGLLAESGREGQAPSSLVFQAISVIARAAGPDGMVGGQAVDLEYEGREIDEELVAFLHSHKTAALISAAVTSGAILGGGGQAQVAALAEYGGKVGLAFQIVDDILDLEGDEALLGKPVGSDEALRKATYPRAIGLEKAKEKAERFKEEAVAALVGFGPSADPLRGLAAYLLARKR
ncbi:MAG: polyprenyl synthetase family protein [Thermodesulfobacteriota bacterium]